MPYPFKLKFTSLVRRFDLVRFLKWVFLFLNSFSSFEIVLLSLNLGRKFSNSSRWVHRVKVHLRWGLWGREWKIRFFQRASWVLVIVEMMALDGEGARRFGYGVCSNDMAWQHRSTALLGDDHELVDEARCGGRLWLCTWGCAIEGEWGWRARLSLEVRSVPIREVGVE